MTSIVREPMSSSSGSRTPTPTIDPLMGFTSTRCGPQSWKDAQDDEGENAEIIEIFEGRDGGLQEAFGRTQQSFTNSYYKIMYDRNEYLDKNTIRIPKTGPGCPIQSEIATLFDARDDEAILYASGGNIARSVALPSVENVCGICGQTHCQEQAGAVWYEIFGWKFCHMNCWKTTCLNYHRYLDHEDIENTTLNFINYVVNFNHDLMNN